MKMKSGPQHTCTISGGDEVRPQHVQAYIGSWHLQRENKDNHVQTYIGAWHLQGENKDKHRCCKFIILTFVLRIEVRVTVRSGLELGLCAVRIVFGAVRYRWATHSVRGRIMQIQNRGTSYTSTVNSFIKSINYLFMRSCNVLWISEKEDVQT